MLVTGVTASLGFAVSAAGLTYAYRKVEQLPRVELSQVLADPPGTDAPRNVLLVGVDDASGLDPDDNVLNERDHDVLLSDTIMIMRIDPRGQEAAVLSIPRDLWVTFPGTGVESRINTAMARGDGRPDLLIEVLDNELGIPVHNYVQVDFAGFRELVDAIGGVPVYFENPARDRRSGLAVHRTGCVTLNEEQALAYVRSRFYEEEIDGRWRSEPRSDLARVERQQDFLRRTADRAVSRGARNLGTLNSMLDAALASVTVDDELTLRQMRTLAERFRAFDPDALETYVLPVEDDMVGAAEVVRLVEHEAAPVLEVFRDAPEVESPERAEGIEPGADGEQGDGTGPDAVQSDPDLLPGQVSLMVLNGSGRSGEATRAGAELDQAGFGIVGRDNAPVFGAQRTEVRYPPGYEAEADLVARWLQAGADLMETDEVVGVTVVTGTDWSGVRSQARPPGSSSTGAEGVDPIDALGVSLRETVQEVLEGRESTAEPEGAGAGADDEVDEDGEDGEIDGDDDRSDSTTSTTLEDVTERPAC